MSTARCAFVLRAGVNTARCGGEYIYAHAHERLSLEVLIAWASPSQLEIQPQVVLPLCLNLTGGRCRVLLPSMTRHLLRTALQTIRT